MEDVFKKFVHSDTDIEGLLSFSLYIGEEKINHEKNGEINSLELHNDPLTEYENKFKIKASQLLSDYLSQYDVAREKSIAREGRSDALTRLAVRKQSTAQIHLYFAIFFGVFLTLVTVEVLKQFFAYYNSNLEQELKVFQASSMNTNEMIVYCIERVSKKLIYIILVFFIIRSLFALFKSSIQYYQQNLHFIDNLLVVDNLKENTAEPDGLVRDSLNYLLLEKPDSPIVKQTENASSSALNQLIDKLKDLIKALPPTSEK